MNRKASLDDKAKPAATAKKDMVKGRTEEMKAQVSSILIKS